MLITLLVNVNLNVIMSREAMTHLGGASDDVEIIDDSGRFGIIISIYGGGGGSSSSHCGCCRDAGGLVIFITVNSNATIW
jgi:hypothetical protein